MVFKLLKKTSKHKKKRTTARKGSSSTKAPAPRKRSSGGRVSRKAPLASKGGHNDQSSPLNRYTPLAPHKTKSPATKVSPAVQRPTKKKAPAPATKQSPATAGTLLRKKRHAL